MSLIGIDLGGTKIEAVVLDTTHTIIHRKRIATKQQEGYQAILQRIGNLYREMVSLCNSKPTTLGIGTPGTLSPVTGLLRNANTQCLNGKPIANDLQKLLGTKVTVENDANCFALAEATSGAGQGYKTVFGVIMGTGCGGGIVCNGNMVIGRGALAGEWGHTTVDPHGPLCWCGKRGCVETLISGSGLELLYRNNHTDNPLPLPAIITAFRNDEPGAKNILIEFFVNFGRSLSNVINLLDPDIIVLGGGLSNIDELYTVGVNEVYKNIFSDNPDTPIVKNTLGDSAGVIGAALIGKPIL